MQEDIEHRSATLIINSSKFTGRTLKSAIAKLLQYAEEDDKGRTSGDRRVLPGAREELQGNCGQVSVYSEKAAVSASASRPLKNTMYLGLSPLHFLMA